jgi:hypothetical protein
VHGCLRDPGASIGLRHGNVLIGVGGIALCRRQEVLLQRVMIGRCARLRSQSTQLRVGEPAASFL